MVSPAPLFPGLPGGPELLIVLFVMLLLFGVSTLLVGGAALFGLRYFRGGDTREERLEELEREVHELRGRLEGQRTAGDSASAEARPPTDDADAGAGSRGDDTDTDASSWAGDTDDRER